MTAHPQGFGRAVTYMKPRFESTVQHFVWEKQSGWLRDYQVSDGKFYAVVEGNDGSLNFVEAADIQFAD